MLITSNFVTLSRKEMPAHPRCLIPQTTSRQEIVQNFTSPGILYFRKHKLEWIVTGTKCQWTGKYLWKRSIPLIAPRGIGSSLAWHMDSHGLEQDMFVKAHHDRIVARIGFASGYDLVVSRVHAGPEGHPAYPTVCYFLWGQADKYSWHANWEWYESRPWLTERDERCDERNILISDEIFPKKWVNGMRLQQGWRCQFHRKRFGNAVCWNSKSTTTRRDTDDQDRNDGATLCGVASCNCFEEVRVSRLVSKFQFVP